MLLMSSTLFDAMQIVSLSMTITIQSASVEAVRAFSQGC